MLGAALFATAIGARRAGESANGPASLRLIRRVGAALLLFDGVASVVWFYLAETNRVGLAARAPVAAVAFFFPLMLAAGLGRLVFSAVAALRIFEACAPLRQR